MRIVAITDQGRRESNEDSFFKYSNDKFFGGLIADGMGGHNKGDVASKLAADVIKDYIMSNFKPTMDSFDVSELMRAAITKANDRIYQMAVKNPICKGMGTTVTMAMAFDKWLITAHVGDSRAYALEKDTIEKLTRDHSYVEELIDRGVINAEEAKRHPQRNCITRAVGSERSVMVDIGVHRYGGETVVLCSDGLWAYVSDADILKTVKDSENFEIAAEHLVELALLNGSNDNITAIIFKGKKAE